MCIYLRDVSTAITYQLKWWLTLMSQIEPSDLQYSSYDNLKTIISNTELKVQWMQHGVRVRVFMKWVESPCRLTNAGF